MGPSDFVHKVLVSGIAFTVITAVVMMGIAYVGYSSEVMHANLRRILTSGLVILFLIGAVAGALIYFPQQVSATLNALGVMVTQTIDSLSAMASR